MEKREYTVYKYSELPKESQAKAIKKWRDGDQMEWLPEDMNYKLEELLKEYKITTTEHKPYYSLTCSQGDGAMFEMYGEWIYCGKTYYITVKHAGHYNHKYSRALHIKDENREYIGDNKAIKKFTEIYENICDELEKYGYDCIETQQGDENIIEIFKANDYNFTIKGDID